MAMKVVPEVELDPVIEAILKAPVVEATREEMAAFEEGLAEIRAGRKVSAAQVRAGIEARAKR